MLLVIPTSQFLSTVEAIILQIAANPLIISSCWLLSSCQIRRRKILCWIVTQAEQALLHKERENPNLLKLNKKIGSSHQTQGFKEAAVKLKRKKLKLKKDLKRRLNVLKTSGSISKRRIPRMGRVRHHQ